MNPPIDHQNPNAGNENENENEIQIQIHNSISRNNAVLSTASNLTRSELLRRRFRNLNRLSRCYRDIYWILINRLNTLHRQYLSETALSPFKDLNEDNTATTDDCAFSDCRLKAMPCTLFCRLHILADPNQHLYKPCTFVIKSARDGPITCAKPIMRSIVPAYCKVHMQIAQKHLNAALNREGLNVSPTTKVTPKLHELVPEFVRQIQAKRRKIKEEETKSVVEKEDDS